MQNVIQVLTSLLLVTTTSVFSKAVESKAELEFKVKKKKLKILIIDY